MEALMLILSFQVHIGTVTDKVYYRRHDLKWVDFHVLGGKLSHKFLTKNLSIRNELNPVLTALNELAVQLSLRSSVIFCDSSDDSGSIIPKYNLTISWSHHLVVHINHIIWVWRSVPGIIVSRFACCHAIISSSFALIFLIHSSEWRSNSCSLWTWNTSLFKFSRTKTHLVKNYLAVFQYRIPFKESPTWKSDRLIGCRYHIIWSIYMENISKYIWPNVDYGNFICLCDANSLASISGYHSSVKAYHREFLHPFLKHSFRHSLIHSFRHKIIIYKI